MITTVPRQQQESRQEQRQHDCSDRTTNPSSTSGIILHTNINRSTYPHCNNNKGWHLTSPTRKQDQLAKTRTNNDSSLHVISTTTINETAAETTSQPLELSGNTDSLHNRTKSLEQYSRIRDESHGDATS